MQPVRVAILGAGFISDIHLECYKRFIPHAEVIAVYTRNESKAKSFAEKHGIAHWYINLDEIINNSSCDVVDICLPNFYLALLMHTPHK